MSWDAPEQRWQFPIGDEPPSDLPAAWASACRAVTRDLGCRRDGRSIGFHNVWWTFLADNGAVCVGFDPTGDADVGAYARTGDFRLEATEVEAMVWLAGEVQYELTGYEFVQWPAAGRHLLFPRIVDNRASWVDPTTEAVIAPIGALCDG